jgi:hypothetical protein
MEALRDKENEEGVDILRGVRQVETSSTMARASLHVDKHTAVSRVQGLTRPSQWGQF